MNNKKSKLLKAAISIIAVAVLVVCGLHVTKTFSVKDDGCIKVEIIDINDSLIKEKNVEFVKGDNIIDLIENNFDGVVYQDSMIMEIEGIKTPSDWSTFICIYINDEMSMVGLSEIEFRDGDKISFIETKMEY